MLPCPLLPACTAAGFLYGGWWRGAAGGSDIFIVALGSGGAGGHRCRVLHEMRFTVCPVWGGGARGGSSETLSLKSWTVKNRREKRIYQLMEFFVCVNLCGINLFIYSSVYLSVDLCSFICLFTFIFSSVYLSVHLFIFIQLFIYRFNYM